MDRTWSSVAPARAENDGEREEAAQDQAVAGRPGQGVTAGGHPHGRITPEHGLEGNLGFQPGQRRPRAVMDPVAEPEVRPVLRLRSSTSRTGNWSGSRLAVSPATSPPPSRWSALIPKPQRSPPLICTEQPQPHLIHAQASELQSLTATRLQARPCDQILPADYERFIAAFTLSTLVRIFSRYALLAAEAPEIAGPRIAADILRGSASLMAVAHAPTARRPAAQSAYLYIVAVRGSARSCRSQDGIAWPLMLQSALVEAAGTAIQAVTVNATARHADPRTTMRDGGLARTWSATRTASWPPAWPAAPDPVCVRCGSSRGRRPALPVERALSGEPIGRGRAATRRMIPPALPYRCLSLWAGPARAAL